uniref:Uncharacterized protein n=1 Tax=Cacopsylla melanoneura TaxID=428564 RepID=A0A8D8Z884_9HEMI
MFMFFISFTFPLPLPLPLSPYMYYIFFVVLYLPLHLHKFSVVSLSLCTVYLYIIFPSFPHFFHLVSTGPKTSLSLSLPFPYFHLTRDTHSSPFSLIPFYITLSFFLFSLHFVSFSLRHRCLHYQLSYFSSLVDIDSNILLWC